MSLFSAPAHMCQLFLLVFLQIMAPDDGSGPEAVSLWKISDKIKYRTILLGVVCWC